MGSTTQSLRPLSVSEIIDETFQLYRQKFVLFASISAVLTIPLGIIQILEQIAINRQTTTSGLLSVGLMTLVITVLQFLVRLGILSAIIYAASELRLGRNPGVQESYTQGMDHLPAMIKVTLMISIILVLTSITIIGIPVAIYLGVCWLLALLVSVVEGEGGFASLSRSRELVKDNWWRVVGITLLVSMIVFIINLVFSIPSAVAGASVFLSQGTTSLSTSATVISTLFSTAGSIVTGPILYIAWLLLYYDLRARKEGLDLEIMARQAEVEARTASMYQ